MVRIISPEERAAREAEHKAQMRAIELKNEMIASKLLAKSSKNNDEEKTINLSPSQKISANDLMILANSPKFNKGKGEEDCFNNTPYFVNMDVDDSYVVCKNCCMTRADLIKDMCAIANKEQLCVYGKFNRTPIVIEPKESFDTAYQYFKKVDSFFEETYDSYLKYIDKTFGKDSKIEDSPFNVSEYAKAKKQAGKFVKENPGLPFSEEMVAYSIFYARNSCLEYLDKGMPSLIRLIGRDAELTKKALDCMEVSQNKGFPLVFNRDKIKELSESRVSQGYQTPNQTIGLNRSTIRG